MWSISTIELESKYVPIMEKLINDCIIDNPPKSDDSHCLFRYIDASAAMVRSYMHDGLYEEACGFVYDLQQLNLEVPRDLIGNLGEWAYKNNKPRLIQMLMIADKSLRSVHMAYNLKDLRDTMDKNGELLEKQFVKAKYYTQTNKYLQSFFKNQDLIAGEIYKIQDDNEQPQDYQEFENVDESEEKEDLETSNQKVDLDVKPTVRSHKESRMIEENSVHREFKLD